MRDGAGLNRAGRTGARGDVGGWRALALNLALALLLSGCRDEVEPNPHPPDPLLQDSLGLTLDDRVHRVVITNSAGADTVVPEQVIVAPGDFVEFLAADRWVRMVSFSLEGLGPEQADFLRSSGQVASVPLIELASRFVVSFEGAPEGAYPFLIEGSGRSGTGSIVVREPPRRGLLSRWR